MPASTQNRLARAQMPQPDYPALTLALVAKGFAVLVPQRLGHGKTGGPYLEDQEGCDNAEYAMSARTTAEEIAIALAFIRAQSFARKDASVIVGHSAGGWGALALTDRSSKVIGSIVCVCASRGGRKDDRANSICAPDRLIAAAKEFGEDARVPVTWLVAENDLRIFRRSSQSRWPTRSSKRGRQGGCSGAAALRQGRPLARGSGR